MARVKGRDVLLDLMDSMAELRATVAQQGEQLERVATLAQGTSTRVAGLVAQVEGLVVHVAALAQDLTGLAQAVRDTAVTNLAIQRNLGRSARLIGELAGSTRTRFDELEQRVGKLERKAS